VAETELELSSLSNAARKTRVERPGFLAGLATVLGTQAGCVAMSVILEIIYARVLGPSGRGTISLTLMAIAFGVLLGGLGGEIPLMVWSADRRRKANEWLPAVVFWGAIGAFGSSGLWSLLYWVWHPAFLKGITPALAMLVLISIPSNILYSYVVAMVTGHEQFRGRAGVLLINQAAVLVSFLLLLVLFLRDARTAVLANLLGLLCGTIIGLRLLRKQIFGNWDFSAAKEKLGQALSLGVRGQIGNLATFFNYRLDVFIVNYFLNPSQVGLYAVGVLVSESLWQVPQAAAVTLLPRTARTLGEQDISFTCAVIRQVFALTCISGIVLALLSPIVIPVVFGGRFSPSVTVVFWILPGTIAFAAGKVVSAELAARGKPEYSSIFACVALAVTVVLDVALIPRMGISGAALASSVAYLVDALLITMALKREIRVRWADLLFPSTADLAIYSQAWRKLRNLATA
jgi:O-antigen/teichoic acid export membrane protein